MNKTTQAAQPVANPAIYQSVTANIEAATTRAKIAKIASLTKARKRSPQN